MQTAENVVNSIIDLDMRAEDVIVKAREKADEMRRLAHERVEKDRSANDERIAGKVAAIESESSRKRGAEVERVGKEYEGKVEAVKRTDSAAIGKVVDMIVARIKDAAR